MDSTGDRIVAAATAEFSQYGIAGARVERIAKAARTSKERVYAYFRSKEELYRHVATQALGAIAEATRLDPADLPGYAGRVRDYFVSHPERYRLMQWGLLELAPDQGLPIQYKIDQLRQAQEAGQLDPSWNPYDVLLFVNQLAVSGGTREGIVAAVERLFPATRNPR